MSVLTFRYLTILDVERLVAGRCLTDERFLRLCLDALPLDCWRSHEGEDLSRVFYALAGRLDRGAYDPATNEDDLAAGFSALEPRDGGWTAYLDSLWSPWMAVQRYAAAVLDALVAGYSLEDADVQVRRDRLKNYPLAIDTAFEDDIWYRLREVIAERRTQRYRKEQSLQSPGPPPAGAREKGGRFVGGITL